MDVMMVVQYKPQYRPGMAAQRKTSARTKIPPFPTFSHQKSSQPSRNLNPGVTRSSLSRLALAIIAVAKLHLASYGIPACARHSRIGAMPVQKLI